MTQVIQANVQAIQSLQNTVFISTANESTNGQCLKIPKASGQVISDGNPITTGSGQTVFWNFAVPEGSVINTANSYIEYKVKFAPKPSKCTVVPADKDNGQDRPNGTLQTVNPDPNTNFGFLPPGRYTITETMLWCEPAYINSAGLITGFGQRWAIMQFPMNSSVILDTSTVQYGNMTQTDNIIAFQRPLIQAALSEEYQAMYPTQFFDQDIDSVMQFIIGQKQADGTYKTPTDNTTTFVPTPVYKTFTIALNMINQLFDIKNKFYTLAYTRQLVQLQIKLQPYSLAKLFFTEDVLDKTTTGITEMELYCYLKSSSVLPSEMSTKGEFTQNFHKYQMDSLTLNGSLGGANTAYLSSGHYSSNDVMLCLSLPDTNSNDSTYLKQRYTLYTATEICNIYNKKRTDVEFIFFNNLNVIRGSAQYRYFSEDLTNPVLMKHETLRSMCALQQYQTSVSPSFNTMQKMMTKYAMVRINLEAYSTESVGDSEVILDGYYSLMQRILIQTSFLHYNITLGTTQSATAPPAYNKIANDQIYLYAFQTFDQFVKVNPASGTMTLTEDIKQ